MCERRARRGLFRSLEVVGEKDAVRLPLGHPRVAGGGLCALHRSIVGRNHPTREVCGLKALKAPKNKRIARERER